MRLIQFYLSKLGKWINMCKLGKYVQKYDLISKMMQIKNLGGHIEENILNILRKKNQAGPKL